MREVLDSGDRVHGEHMVAFVAPGSGGVAFVAGRKTGNAVQRNRSRRLLRAAWAACAPQVAEGEDVVLVARRGTREVGSPALAEEILELLGRARA